MTWEVRWARAVTPGRAPVAVAPTPRAPPAASGCPTRVWARGGAGGLPGDPGGPPLSAVPWQAGARPLPARPAPRAPGAGGGGHPRRPRRALRLQPPRVRELQLEGLRADGAHPGGRGSAPRQDRRGGAGRGQDWARTGRGGVTPLSRAPQPRIVARLDVTSPDLFRLVFRYVNRGPTSVSGRVSMREEGKFTTCANCECPSPRPAPAHLGPPAPALPRAGTGGEPALGCGQSLTPTPGTEQSQPVVFPPSTEPAFVTVPQRGFGEPFVLNPGTWALLVEAEGVLLVRQGTSVGASRGAGGGGARGGCRTDLPLPPRTTWPCCPVRTTRRPSCSCGWPKPAPSGPPPSAPGRSERGPAGAGA